MGRENISIDLRNVSLFQLIEIRVHGEIGDSIAGAGKVHDEPALVTESIEVLKTY